MQNSHQINGNATRKFVGRARAHAEITFSPITLKPSNAGARARVRVYMRARANIIIIRPARDSFSPRAIYTASSARKSVNAVTQSRAYTAVCLHERVPAAAAVYTRGRVMARKLPIKLWSRGGRKLARAPNERTALALSRIFQFLGTRAPGPLFESNRFVRRDIAGEQSRVYTVAPYTPAVAAASTLFNLLRIFIYTVRGERGSPPRSRRAGVA